MQLITPDQEILKLDYFTRLDKWEDKVAEYERLSGDKVSDKIMAGVLFSVLAPKEMAKHDEEFAVLKARILGTMTHEEKMETTDDHGNIDGLPFLILTTFMR